MIIMFYWGPLATCHSSAEEETHASVQRKKLTTIVHTEFTLKKP